MRLLGYLLIFVAVITALILFASESPGWGVFLLFLAWHISFSIKDSKEIKSLLNAAMPTEVEQVYAAPKPKEALFDEREVKDEPEHEGFHFVITIAPKWHKVIAAQLERASRIGYKDLEFEDLIPDNDYIQLYGTWKMNYETGGLLYSVRSHCYITGKSKITSSHLSECSPVLFHLAKEFEPKQGDQPSPRYFKPDERDLILAFESDDDDIHPQGKHSATLGFHPSYYPKHGFSDKEAYEQIKPDTLCIYRNHWDLARYLYAIAIGKRPMPARIGEPKSEEIEVVHESLPIEPNLKLKQEGKFLLMRTEDDSVSCFVTGEIGKTPTVFEHPFFSMSFFITPIVKEKWD